MAEPQEHAVKEKGRWERHGDPAHRRAGGCPASPGGAGSLWGQAGWTMVAPGEVHGGILAMCTALGTYDTKRKKKNPGLEKAAGEGQAVCHGLPRGEGGSK